MSSTRNTIGGMAVLSTRAKAGLLAIQSIIHQLDHLTVTYNDVSDDIRAAMQFKIDCANISKDKISVIISDNKLGDAAKFQRLFAVNEELVGDSYTSPDAKQQRLDWIKNTVSFSLDDDLEYPSDYVKTSLLWLDSAKFWIQDNEVNQVAIGYHGRSVPDSESFPLSSYYRNTITEVSAIGGAPHSAFSLTIGTGALAVQLTEDLVRNFSKSKFTLNYASDVFFAGIAKESNMCLLAVAHPTDWIKYLLENGEYTIFGAYHDKDEKVTEAVNRLLGPK
jgi:hypothetical protein